MFQKKKWMAIKTQLVGQKPGVHLDSALAKCLSSIKNNPDVYTREYGFQEKVVENGELVSENEIPETLRYAKVPLGIILNNAVEVFYKHDHEDVLQPVRILYPGDLVGTFEALDFLSSERQLLSGRNKYSYCLTAGAKSILPSTTFERPSQVRNAVKNHIRITSKKSATDLPRRQERMLHEVLQAAEHKAKNWKVEIAFLPMECIANDFRTYLFEHGWSRTQVLRHLAEPDVDKKFEYNPKLISERRPRARDHANFLKNIARDLYLVAHGQLPCFVPVQRDNNGASLHSLLGPFADAYLLLNESNPRLEFLVPGYLDGTEIFGIYPLNKSCHKTLCVKPELSRACIDLLLYRSGQHEPSSEPYEQVPILSPTTNVDVDESRGIKYIGSKGAGAPFKGGVDLEKLPFEIGKGASRPNPSATQRPLYRNDVPITGSVLIIKKGILD